MRHLALAPCLLAFASAAMAAEVPPPTIAVIGSGRAERPADYALLNFTLRGEGATSPEAVKALAGVQAKVDASLPKLPGKPATEARSTNLQIREVRGKGCENRGYGNPQLTSGDCAVVGFVATQTFQLRVTPATKAGDAASLVVQIGGFDLNASGGGVSDERALEDAAMRDAVADAKRQAELLAVASGVKLGPIIRVQDNQATPIVVTGSAVNAPPPPPLPVPPVQLASPLSYAPQPIVRTARVMVTYGLEP